VTITGLIKSSSVSINSYLYECQDLNSQPYYLSYLLYTHCPTQTLRSSNQHLLQVPDASSAREGGRCFHMCTILDTFPIFFILTAQLRHCAPQINISCKFRMRVRAPGIWIKTRSRHLILHFTLRRLKNAVCRNAYKCSYTLAC